MPNGLVVLRRCVTLAFLRDDMQHTRSAMVFDLTEDTYQSHYVVTVCRSEITNVQSREDIARLLGEDRFEAVVTAQDSTPFALIYQVQFGGQLINAPTPFVISRAGGQVHEILRDTALERVNRHVVIIEHNKQVVLIHRGVVQSLESQTAGHSSIADDRYDIMIVRDVES